MDEITVLKNIVRIGTVDSVNVEKRTARVRFADKNNLVSGELKVLQNHPLIVIEKEVDGDKWNSTAQYASADRGLTGGSITYTKAAPDTITLEKIIEYEKTLAIPEDAPTCPIAGKIDEKTHKHTVTVYPWLPYIGQMVLCIFLPIGGGDGFVIGGI